MCVSIMNEEDFKNFKPLDLSSFAFTGVNILVVDGFDLSTSKGREEFNKSKEGLKCYVDKKSGFITIEVIH